MSKLTISTSINALPETVWEALWKPEHIVNWCFASDDWHCPKAVGNEPKVGEIFSNTFAAKDGSFSFDLVGRYEVVEPMKRIVYTMGEMKEFFLPAGRQVEIIFGPSRYHASEDKWGIGTHLTETFDAEDIHSTEQQIEGWSAILKNLKKYVESNL